MPDARRFRVTRDVELEWASFTEGEIVYEFKGATYGCITWEGIAVTRGPDATSAPFLEIPFDAIVELSHVLAEEPQS